MSGWIKLHRSIIDHPLFSFDSPDKALAWIYLIASANHSSNKFMIKNTMIKVDRGQLAMSQVTLQKKFKWSQNKLKRFLELLKKEGMIDYKTDALTTLITICNYSDYQGDERAGELPSERPVERRVNDQTNDKQECKNEKNVNNNLYKQIDLSGLPVEISVDDQKSFIDYKVKWSNKNKKPSPTDRAIKQSLNQAVKINKELGISYDEIFGTVEEKGWSGIKFDYFTNQQFNGSFNQRQQPAMVMSSFPTMED